MTKCASVDDVAGALPQLEKIKDRVEELLDTLVSLGKVRELKDRRFLAAQALALFLRNRAFRQTGVFATPGAI